MSYTQLRIAKIIQETPDARSFVLEIPADLAEKYRYRAGQFLTFRVPHADGAFNRCYSLSSAPETDGLPKVTIKRVAGGKGSNWFHDSVTEGGTLEVLPPAGRFVLGDGDAPLLLFGGGSGITPMMSLIKSALKQGRRQIRLFYANRDKPSVIFDGEFEALLAAHPGKLEIVHHLDSTQGIIKPEEIVAAMKGYEAGDVYLCGPGPFMKLVEETLFEHGMPHDKVRIERFEASGNDAIPIQPSEEGDVVPGEITIHFEGKVHKVAYAKGQTILEAARAGGLNPLSSCEEGFCASCAAKTIKGKVMLAKNDIYTPEDLANHWILTCQGHCFGAEVEITYDVV
ncbi:ferredoxin--NADP reductase [Reyranella sp.]|jgi:3-ketosteroid 9alpha-monooxygenase subunit B|uniref:ferredoxin--NADP reductase n=1 Tax=Reyranella sp. TaxID=1929291 RepID=UPI00260850A7|nr:ferredoxin--NADP reductase [Reyranella sp.]HQS15698.1 ferredoxin--NADP reductase [Reyranella sp.]HQT12964.1 ferredoxin--NADP reductase [Reyranella sp.]